MTKALSMICAVMITTVFGSPALTIFNQVSPVPMSKAEFVEYCHSIHAPGDRAAAISDEDADLLLMQYAMNSGKEERAQIESQLNDAGIFIYNGGAEKQIAPLSPPSDVTISNVICSYNDNTGDWSLVSGGRWNNSDYTDANKMPAAGFRTDIGGFDAVGIMIGNTSGPVPRLKFSVGTVYDEKGNTMTIANPSTPDTKKGIAFMYQDTITMGANASRNYMGDSFASVMRFGSDFMDWNGDARGFYLHTWSKTTISSIGFDVGKENFGLSVSWSKDTNHFDAYSRMDTRF